MESPVLLSAKREANKEANVDFGKEYIQLDAVSSIPADCFKNSEELWGEDCCVMPEYCFGVKAGKFETKLSREHSEY